MNTVCLVSKRSENDSAVRFLRAKNYLDDRECNHRLIDRLNKQYNGDGAAVLMAAGHLRDAAETIDVLNVEEAFGERGAQAKTISVAASKSIAVRQMMRDCCSKLDTMRAIPLGITDEMAFQANGAVRVAKAKSMYRGLNMRFKTCIPNPSAAELPFDLR